MASFIGESTLLRVERAGGDAVRLSDAILRTTRAIPNEGEILLAIQSEKLILNDGALNQDWNHITRHRQGPDVQGESLEVFVTLADDRIISFRRARHHLGNQACPSSARGSPSASIQRIRSSCRGQLIRRGRAYRETALAQAGVRAVHTTAAPPAPTRALPAHGLEQRGFGRQCCNLQARPDRHRYSRPASEGRPDERMSASPMLWAVAEPMPPAGQALGSAGYIVGYGAHINLAKITETVTVFTEVTLSDHRREDFVKFESNIRNFDEIIECHLISGGYDYLLRFITRSITHYQTLIDSIIDRNIGIEKYFSYIVIKSMVNKNAVPLQTLLKEP